jgi:hypothetical protein
MVDRSTRYSTPYALTHTRNTYSLFVPLSLTILHSFLPHQMGATNQSVSDANVGEGPILRGEINYIHTRMAARDTTLTTAMDGLIRATIEMRGEIASLRGDIGGLRGDVNSLRGDVNSLRGDVTVLRGELLASRGTAAVKGEGEVTKREG